MFRAGVDPNRLGSTVTAQGYVFVSKVAGRSALFCGDLRFDPGRPGAYPRP